MTKPPRPTDAELAILRILWERGACTVRQVHEALSTRRATPEELGEIRKLIESNREEREGRHERD
jgi:predicted transcriptional regulator